MNDNYPEDLREERKKKVLAHYRQIREENKERRYMARKGVEFVLKLLLVIVLCCIVYLALYYWANFMVTF